jgi:CrcB protein
MDLKLPLIFFGAGLGGLMRYWVAGVVQTRWGPGLPVGTLVVNVSGCLVIGFLATLFSGPLLVREEYRIGLLIGLLGGYTTFATFGRETMALLADGQWFLALSNVLLCNILGLAAVWGGARIATLLYGGDGP